MRWARHVAHIEGRKLHTGFWWGDLRERDHLEDLGIGGRMILMWIFEKWCGGGGMGWIDLAENMDRWRALVNVLMDLHAFYNAGNLLTI